MFFRSTLSLFILLLSLSSIAQTRKTTSRGSFSNQPPPSGFTLGSFANTPDYQSGAQVAKRISDTLAANPLLVSGAFKINGKTLDLAQPTGTTATVVDAVPTLNSPNAISSGAVYAALQAYAKVAHTQTASTILDFGPAILTWMQAQSGFGAGTVFGNNGTWVSATGGTALTPLVATTLTAAATSPTDSKIVLSWLTVPNATTYVVEQAIDAQFSNGSYAAYTGSALTFTQSNLAAGTPYFYRIKAKASGFADSDYGFATLATTGASVPTLSAPAVTAGSATSSTVAFSWGAVSNATSYSVSFATNAAFTMGLTSFTTTATSYNPTGLSPATTYYLGVQAQASGFTSSGTGTASLATSATVTPGAATTALGSTSLSFASITTSGATASWAAVPNATGYLLQRATDNGFTANVSSTTLGNVTTATLSGLSASTQYFNRILASGGGNYTDGANSAVATFTTSATVSGGASTTALANTKTLYMNGITTTTAAVSWSQVANVTSANSNAYQLEISTSNTFASTLTTVNSGTVAMGTFTGLTPGTNYFLRMKSLGSGSWTESPYSDMLSITTPAAGAGTFTVERTVKVNLATSSNANSVATWNTIAPASASITVGYSSPAFVDATGASTPFAVSVVSGFSGGGVNNFGGAASVPNSVWPALVMNRAWNYASGAGVLRLTGLQTSKVYQIYVLQTGTTNTYHGTVSVAGATTQTAGVKYLVQNGIYSAADEFTGPALQVANNVTTTTGTVDLTFGYAGAGLSSRPVVGFIIQECNQVK